MLLDELKPGLRVERLIPAEVADEVIANLREDGTQLVVKIEIEATKPTGFDEGQVRTLSENARTLKFDQSGFEES